MPEPNPMEPIYAKIFGNETVQPVEENSPVSLQLGDFCVNIKSAGGSVTIKITESAEASDTLSSS